MAIATRNLPVGAFSSFRRAADAGITIIAARPRPAQADRNGVDMSSSLSLLHDLKRPLTQFWSIARRLQSGFVAARTKLPDAARNFAVQGCGPPCLWCST